MLENKDIVLGQVGAIIQDQEGFMWFGGQNSLLRFDGYEYKEFNVSPLPGELESKESLIWIWALHQDKQGIIWIGTRWGLFRLDPKTEHMIRIPDNDQTAIPLSIAHIYEFDELDSGEIICSTMEGIYTVQKNGEHSLITTGSDKPSLHNKNVLSSYIDKSGIYWLGTGAGLERFDTQTKQISLIKPYPQDPNSIAKNKVNTLAPSPTQAELLYIGTTEGLVIYNTLTRANERFIHNNNEPSSLPGNNVAKLKFDQQGILWIATDSGGVGTYDPKLKKFNRYRYEIGNKLSLNSNIVRSIYEDKNGDIWLGNYPEGINFFDRSSAAISTYTQSASNPNSLSHNSVLSIDEDSQGGLWMGTDGGGLNYLDLKSNTFTHFKHDETKLNSLPSNAVLKVYVDSGDKVWLGMWGGGLAVYDPKSQQFTRFPFAEKEFKQSIERSTHLSSSHVWYIYEDSNQTLWVATHTGGLNQYDPSNQQFIHYGAIPYGAIPNAPSTIASNLVWTVFEDSKQNFWLGTNEALVLFNRVTKTFTNFYPDSNNPKSLSNGSVLSIFEDSQNNIWIGTDDGLNLLNPLDHTFTRFSKKQGLLNTVIRSITEDDKGKLWLGTNNGVSRFDPNTKNFNRDSGMLVGGFNTGAVLLTTNNKIAFGGVNGLRIYDPSGLKGNPLAPSIVLTDLKIFADSVDINAEDGLLTQAIHHTQHIELDHHKSMFVLEYAALNFRDSEKNQYR